MSTHQQLLYHMVFSTKHRRRWLTDGFREDVFAYMAGTCRKLGGSALIVGGYVDHVHLLVHIPAKVAVSEFVGKLKSSTSKHINDTRETAWGQTRIEPATIGWASQRRPPNDIDVLHGLGCMAACRVTRKRNENA